MKDEKVFLYFITGAVAVGLICGLTLGWGIFSKEIPPKPIYCKSYFLTADKLRKDLELCEMNAFNEKAKIIKKTIEEQKRICKSKRDLDRTNFDEVFAKVFQDCNLKWSIK